MSNRPKAPTEIATLTAGLDPDVADVIAADSERMAEERERDGTAIDPSDEQTASYLLGRPFTRREALALEACICHYVAAIEAAESREGETEQEAGRRIDEERNDRAGREINALARLQRAGIDSATCGEEEAAAVVGPLMAANLCRQARQLAALGYVPD